MCHYANLDYTKPFTHSQLAGQDRTPLTHVQFLHLNHRRRADNLQHKLRNPVPRTDLEVCASMVEEDNAHVASEIGVHHLLLLWGGGGGGVIRTGVPNPLHKRRSSLASFLAGLLLGGRNSHPSANCEAMSRSQARPWGYSPVRPRRQGERNVCVHNLPPSSLDGLGTCTLRE